MIEVLDIDHGLILFIYPIECAYRTLVSYSEFRGIKNPYVPFVLIGALEDAKGSLFGFRGLIIVSIVSATL